MKSLFCIAAILTLSTVCRAHEVAAVTSTDIRGWYIGESFQDWSKNPTLGGNADVCHGKKIPGNVKQWCKTYLAAESGQGSTVEVPPFSFVFRNLKVLEIRVHNASYEQGRDLVVAKFGQPTQEGVGGGDIVTIGGFATGTGRSATWTRPDGAFIQLQEIIVASSIGTTRSATISVLTHQSLNILSPTHTAQLPSL